MFYHHIYFKPTRNTLVFHATWRHIKNQGIVTRFNMLVPKIRSQYLLERNYHLVGLLQPLVFYWYQHLATGRVARTNSSVCPSRVWDKGVVGPGPAWATLRKEVIESPQPACHPHSSVKIPATVRLGVSCRLPSSVAHSGQYL